jgi:hypothetical protein
MILGIDIGGANTKISSSDGSFIRSYYLPLWEKSLYLYDLLVDLKEEIKEKEIEIEDLGVVMTGELSDCFDDKEGGVRYIYNTVKSVFDDAKFLTGRFPEANDECIFKREIDEAIHFSSKNWIASSILIGSLYKNAIFLDIGSTTTDIIPIVNGRPVAGITDIERLKQGELIYSGILRTNIVHILPKVIIDDSTSVNRHTTCPTSSELFSITADVYSVLGDISSEDYTCETPNLGNKKDVKSSMERIARVVCCDLKELGEKNVISIAKQVKERQIIDIIDSILKMNERYRLNKIVTAGVGEFLAEEVADRLDMECISISSIYGKDVSSVFPAYAVAKLLEKESFSS